MGLSITGPLLPLAALGWPLLLGAMAALPGLRRHAIGLLPLAPLPALALALQTALTGPSAERTRLPGLLLGVELGIDARAALFVGMAALLWLLAGVYAVRYLRGTRQPAVFAGFWCLTLAGNLGVFLARDAASFYAAFAAVSLSAYLLVVHEGTARARRAGRLYLGLAVVGEAALLAGLLLGVHAADSLDIVEVRAALAGSPWRDTASALLILGFGLKAGLMPLHVWLPLAHPAAPTPASAVLSGAIVKAGLFGMMVFLPVGPDPAALPWGPMLATAGLLSAGTAVLIGLTQRNPKALLAYSTISQMGLLVAVLGAGLAQADAGPALDAVALGALHHGLAKGALFLSVGIFAASSAGHRRWVLAGVALAALSVAGLPLTGGALAKAALKGPLAGTVAETLLALSAVGTALLLLRFGLLLQRQALAAEAAAPPPLLVLPWLLLVAAAWLLPWGVAGMLQPGASAWRAGDPGSPTTLWAGAPWSAAAVWTGAWPLLLAGGIAAAARRWRMRPPHIPEGDLALPLERLARAAVGAVAAFAARTAGDRADGQGGSTRPGRTGPRWPDPGAVLARLDHQLSRWSVAGVLVLLALLAVAAATA
jgi:hydrogenase-4 component B